MSRTSLKIDTNQDVRDERVRMGVVVGVVVDWDWANDFRKESFLLRGLVVWHLCLLVLVLVV